MLKRLLREFFTHKDFLPPADEWAGTLFSPLQIIFCACLMVIIVFSCIHCAKKSEKYQKTVFFVLWAIIVITEPLQEIYNAYAGREYFVEWESALALWPCSVFIFTAPFAIFGKGLVRESACGYICTLGLLGGAINFVYPATYLSRYSCISMSGLRTIFYHGSMVFIALTMLLSGYHSFKSIESRKMLILPAVPFLIVSVPANIVNLVIPTADYMFFKMESFFFAPIGRATPNWLSLILVYAIYLIIHIVPYLPHYFKSKKAPQ